MKIVVVSSVYRSTPPVGYGGVERVVHCLVEELVRLGHDVILFATPGSSCSGRTVQVSGYDPSHAPSGITSRRHQLSEEPLFRALEEFVAQEPPDVLHDWSFQNLFVERHPERLPFLVSTCIPQPATYRRGNLVAASAAHRDLLGGSIPYVHYGLRLADWSFSYRKQAHAVHIAKIAPYKGQHEALLACRRARFPLWLGGNVEHALYYHLVVRPLLWWSRDARYLGEVFGTSSLLRDAACLIQTPKWFEVFPLISLEALASATPVISYRAGGTAEQIEPGVNGFLCDNETELTEALLRLPEIRPEVCRQFAEERFSVDRMAREYLTLYDRVMSGERW